MVNYTSADVPYTRIIEHKHFEYGTQPKTVITYEYPATWSEGLEPYYPVNNERNNAIAAEYRQMARSMGNVIFGGRSGSMLLRHGRHRGRGSQAGRKGNEKLRSKN